VCHASLFICCCRLLPCLHKQILLLSRLTAIALLVVYASYLVFQLGTHRHLFNGEEEEGGTPALTLTAAMAWLGGITVLVAILSEYLTGSIEEVRACV
jgi:Ca2+:H+ antiporter